MELASVFPSEHLHMCRKDCSYMFPVSVPTPCCSLSPPTGTHSPPCTQSCTQFLYSTLSHLCTSGCTAAGTLSYTVACTLSDTPVSVWARTASGMQCCTA